MPWKTMHNAQAQLGIITVNIDDIESKAGADVNKSSDHIQFQAGADVNKSTDHIVKIRS